MNMAFSLRETVMTLALLTACSSDDGSTTDTNASTTTTTTTATTSSDSGSATSSTSTRGSASSDGGGSTSSDSDGSATADADTGEPACECDSPAAPMACPEDGTLGCSDFGDGALCCDAEGQRWECVANDIGVIWNVDDCSPG